MEESKEESGRVANGEKTPLVSRASAGRTIYRPDLKTYMKTIYFTGVASFGAVGFGITTVYASPLLDDLSTLNTTQWRRGFETCTSQYMIGPIAPIGAMFGAIFSSLFVRFFGLVFPNMLAAIVSAIGWLMIACSAFVCDNPDGFRALLLLGRFVTGFGSGWVAATAPVYIAEIAPAQTRGKLGSLFQLFIGLGTFICYLLGGLLELYWIPAFIFAGLFTLHAIIFLTVAESPLRSRNPCVNGRKFIDSCRVPSSNKQDIDITNDDDDSTLVGQSSLFQWAYVWRIGVIMSVMILQRFSGISAIVYYVGPIMKSAGWKNSVIRPDTAAAIAIGIVLTVSTLLSVLVIDKMGRRIMLFFGSLVMAVANIGLAVYFYTPQYTIPTNTNNHSSQSSSPQSCFHTLPEGKEYAPNLEALPLICISLYCIAYAVSWGPVSWILAGEIFPKRIREVGSAIGSATNWVSTAIITLLFPIMSKEISNGATFFILAGICLLSVFFVIFCLPETRGLTLDQNSNLKFSFIENAKEFLAIMKWFFRCGCCESGATESDIHVQSL